MASEPISLRQHLLVGDCYFNQKDALIFPFKKSSGQIYVWVYFAKKLKKPVMP